MTSYVWAYRSPPLIRSCKSRPRHSSTRWAFLAREIPRYILAHPHFPQLRMTTFTLGTKPPHIDHVRTFPDTEDGELCLVAELHPYLADEAPTRHRHHGVEGLLHSERLVRSDAQAGRPQGQPQDRTRGPLRKGLRECREGHHRRGHVVQRDDAHQAEVDQQLPAWCADSAILAGVPES